MRIFYVNGAFVSEDKAQISVLDRGFLFSDAVYEVSAVLNGKMVDNDAHIARLYRSLDEVRIELPITAGEIKEIQSEIIVQNNLSDGIIYIQVSRGVAERDFSWPANMQPTIVMFTQKKNLRTPPLAERGAQIHTVADIRWQRRDIKTTSLLAQVMAKDEAKRNGADDAWMVQGGFVTEGSSTNAFIVTQDGKIRTRALTADILHGITRKAVLTLAQEQGIELEEAPFTVEEAQNAREAFATGSSFFVLPVVDIDGAIIGNGKPGRLTSKLRNIYIDLADGKPLGGEDYWVNSLQLY